MTTIAEFLVGLGFDVDTKPLDDAAKKAKEAADKSAASWGKVEAGMAKVGKAALAAGAGLLLFAQQSASAGDEIGKVSQRAGLATKDYQRLLFAAKQSGAGQAELADSFKSLSMQIVEAGKGAGPASDALRTLGIRASELIDLSAEERLGKIGDALNNLSNPALKSQISLTLLGGSADKLIPLLDEGSVGIKRLGDQAERLGVVMSDEAIKQSTKFTDELGELKAQIDGVTASIGTALIPIVRKAIQNWESWAVAIGSFATALAAVKLVKFAHEMGLVGSAMGAIKWGAGIGGALAFGVAVGTAADQMFGLSDAIAGVKNTQGKRGVGAFVGEYDAGDFAKMGDLKAERAAIEGDPRQRRDQAHRIRQIDEELAGIEGAATRRVTARQGGEKLRQITVDAGNYAARENATANITAAAAATERAAARAREMKARRGGKSASFSADVSAYDIDADERFGEELAMLAERYGAGSVAVDEATKAAGSALESGALDSVAREAALSRLGSSVGQDLTKKAGSGDPLISAIFGEDVPDMKLSQMAMGAEPQVLIATINNTFTFDNDFSISGAGNPGDVGSSVAAALRDAFQGAIAASTVTAKVNFAR